MTDEIDPELKVLARRRFVQLATWREIVVHGSEDERRRLVESLKEIDIGPLFSALDEDEEEVRAEASEQRRVLAVIELQRMVEEAITSGDIEAAARWLDLTMRGDGCS